MGKVTFINAIVSGKLEGTVYARNKAGYYIKGWTKPLDPRTIAQLQNRAWFSTAASTWHSLTDLQKAAWNSFGASYFVGKKGALVSMSSGFNAFVSMYYTAQFMNNKFRVNTITAPVVTTTTFGAFTPTLTAPVAALSGSIGGISAPAIPLALGAVTLSAATGATTVTINFPAAQLTAPIWTDSVLGEPVGLLVQVSNPNTQMTQFVTNPRIRAVNIIKPIASAVTWTSSSFITLSAAAADLGISGFKNWYTTGQIVEARLYLVSQSGQQKFLGAKMVTVS